MRFRLWWSQKVFEVWGRADQSPGSSVGIAVAQFAQRLTEIMALVISRESAAYCLKSQNFAQFRGIHLNYFNTWMDLNFYSFIVLLFLIVEFCSERGTAFLFNVLFKFWSLSLFTHVKMEDKASSQIFCHFVSSDDQPRMSHICNIL